MQTGQLPRKLPIVPVALQWSFLWLFPNSKINHDHFAIMAANIRNQNIKVMTLLQPDQQPAQWNDHVDMYEHVFETLTNEFAKIALPCLELQFGGRLLDIAAGCGGTALLAAEQGYLVTAIDAAENMVARTRRRTMERQLSNSALSAERMDGQMLALPTNHFDAAISVFGIVLFPDARQGMGEAFRVLKPGGRLAVVTWTEPEKYELAARLVGAAASVKAPAAASLTLPAQLRFREAPAFRELFESAGFADCVIEIHRVLWRLPSARWIAERMAFAPGMAAMLKSYGSFRTDVLDAFVTQLERDQGAGEIQLSATAFIGSAGKPAN